MQNAGCQLKPRDEKPSGKSDRVSWAHGIVAQGTYQVYMLARPKKINNAKMMSVTWNGCGT